MQHDFPFSIKSIDESFYNRNALKYIVKGQLTIP